MSVLFPLTPEMNVLVHRIDETRIYPPFFELYVATLSGCINRGSYFYAIDGTRDDPQQEALYAKGRRKLPDGTWVVVNKKRIVTNAEPGESDHNYGIGIDSCKDKDADRAGLQPDWNIEEYQVLAEEARKQGLNALYYSRTFREGPHVGLDIGRYGITHRKLRELQLRGGIPAVWKFLDGYDWRPR